MGYLELLGQILKFLMQISLKVMSHAANTHDIFSTDNFTCNLKSQLFKWKLLSYRLYVCSVWRKTSFNAYMTIYTLVKI